MFFFFFFNIFLSSKIKFINKNIFLKISSLFWNFFFFLESPNSKWSFHIKFILKECCIFHNLCCVLLKDLLTILFMTKWKKWEFITKFFVGFWSMFTRRCLYTIFNVEARFHAPLEVYRFLNFLIKTTQAMKISCHHQTENSKLI